jgi:hypothetical protein
MAPWARGRPIERLLPIKNSTTQKDEDKHRCPEWDSNPDPSVKVEQKFYWNQVYVLMMIAWRGMWKQSILSNYFLSSVIMFFLAQIWSIYGWSGLKNSPTVTHACRKRRLKWVPYAWGYSWATLSPGVINTEAWSSRLGVGRWTNNPAL